jgi:hypothetical protein
MKAKQGVAAAVIAMLMMIEFFGKKLRKLK